MTTAAATSCTATRRRVLAATMLAWGLCSAATALVRTGGQLLLLRFLLGFPEAGFYPAAILTLSLWYPDTSRSRASTLFTLCATRGP